MIWHVSRKGLLKVLAGRLIAGGNRTRPAGSPSMAPPAC